MFEKAQKAQKKLRLAFIGPSGSGKTYSALSMAKHLGKSIAVIDTERRSSTLYSDEFEFDVCDLKQTHPNKYIEALRAAAGYDVVIVDSFSHAWFEILNIASGHFENWKVARPLERALLDAILDCPAHVIVTMRSKTEYIVEKKLNKQGKEVNAPTKIGTAPVQSSGIEYEFDVVGDLDLGHNLVINKSRCKHLSDTHWHNPGQELAEILQAWLMDGVPMPESRVEKCDRVKAKREEMGLDAESVRTLLRNHFGVASPGDLRSEEVDQLLIMIETICRSAEELEAI